MSNEHTDFETDVNEGEQTFPLRPRIAWHRKHYVHVVYKGLVGMSARSAAAPDWLEIEKARFDWRRGIGVIIVRGNLVVISTPKTQLGIIVVQSADKIIETLPSGTFAASDASRIAKRLRELFDLPALQSEQLAQTVAP